MFVLSARGGRVRPRRSAVAGSGRAAAGRGCWSRRGVERRCPWPSGGEPQDPVGRLRLTSRPGRARSRVRMVRVTVSWSSGWTSPSRAVQRMRLWASTAQPSQAALAKNRPDGQCSSPAPSLRSRMASSTVAWSRWNWSTSTVGSSTLVMKAWCRQSGHSCAWAAVGEPGAAHHEPHVDARCCSAAAGHVGGLGDLGLAAVGVGDVDPAVLVDAVDRLADAGVDAHRDRPARPRDG